MKKHRKYATKLGPLGVSALATAFSGCSLLQEQHSVSIGKEPQIPAVALASAELEKSTSKNAVVSAVHQETDGADAQSAIQSVTYVEPAPVDDNLDCNHCQNTTTLGYPLPCSPAAPTQDTRKLSVQEYIFDGGDLNEQVIVRRDWSSAGVNPTDTVAYYETESGEVCVRPTNRVPIYAPRFGTVRKVTGLFSATKAIATQRVHTPVGPGGFADTDVAGAVAAPLAAQGQEQIHKLDSLQENLAGSLIDGVIPPQRMSDAFVPHEGIEVTGLGRITDEEIAVLGEYIQNAHAWFAPESLGIMVDGKRAARVSSVTGAQDVYTYDIKDGCALRICKTASHTIANSGDKIRFTLRFDNSGTKPIQNVVLLDNLSPRLEYIEGSEHGSVATKFTAEPNEVGSQVLRWQLEKPLAAGEGGAISFDCLVR